MVCSIFLRFSALGSQSGRRYSRLDMSPAIYIAALTGIGLLSQNIILFTA